MRLVLSSVIVKFTNISIIFEWWILVRLRISLKAFKSRPESFYAEDLSVLLRKNSPSFNLNRIRERCPWWRRITEGGEGMEVMPVPTCSQVWHWKIFYFKQKLHIQANFWRDWIWFMSPVPYKCVFDFHIFRFLLRQHLTQFLSGPSSGLHFQRVWKRSRIEKSSFFPPYGIHIDISCLFTESYMFCPL